jgi:acetyl esterase
MTTQALAAVSRVVGQAPAIETVTIDDPRAGEVLVKLVATGVCHTDMVMRDRHLPVPMPVVLGQWAIYPFLGAGKDWESMRQFRDGYMLTQAAMDWFDGLCGSPLADPRYALLLGPAPQTSLVILTSGLDPLRDSGRAYAEKARATQARVVHLEADGMIHGFITMRAALPSAVQDIESVIAAGIEMLG